MTMTTNGFAGPVSSGVGARWHVRAAGRAARRTIWTAACLAAACLAASAAGAEVRVVASIKPVHSLVAAVMAGAGSPELIITGATSPHAFSLRPSDARNIQNAQIIFMVGDALETSLAGSIDTLGRDARVVRLFETDGLMRLPLREGATFEGHDHGGEGDHEAHEGESLDMHVWLDPVNARTMVRAIADTLSAADAINAATYAANAEDAVGRLDALLDRIDADMRGVRGQPFIVLHDAFHYFEHRFGLIAAGAAQISPDRPPGARRISTLRELVSDLEVVCVLAEPQFDSRLANVISEGTTARLGTVDPLGAALDTGPDLYFTLLNDMAASFRDCLAEG